MTLAFAGGVIALCTLLAAGEECDQTMLLQSGAMKKERKKGKSGRKPTTLNQVHPAPDQMLSAIDKAFNGISGGNFVANLPNAKMDAWVPCASIDYSTFSGLDNEGVQQFLGEVGLNDLCEIGDATCDAFNAGFNSMMALRALDAAPRFQNYTLVNWFEGLTGFASWGSGAGQVGKVDYSASPPAASVPYKHAGDGFALCEFTFTILKQNNKQVLNNCGPTSVLAALLMDSPVEAFKKSLQLYYTGSLPGMNHTPCPYVFEQQPGLLPYEAGQPGFSAFPAGTNLCPGRALQQEGAPTSLCQNVGIHQIWITAFLDTYEQKMQEEAGVHDACSRKTFKALYPLESEVEAQITRYAMVVGNAAVVYTCEQVFGNCNFYSPSIALCAKNFKLSEETCKDLLMGKGVAPSDFGLFQMALDPSLGAVTAAAMGSTTGQVDMERLITERPTLAQWFKMMPGSSLQEQIAMIQPVMGVASTPSPDLEATKAMMGRACKAKRAMIYMHGDILTQQSIGLCNHYITLRGCANGNYQLWSWGENFEMPSEFFHKGVCGVTLSE